MSTHKITIYENGKEHIKFARGGDTFEYRDHLGNGFHIKFKGPRHAIGLGALKEVTP